MTLASHPSISGIEFDQAHFSEADIVEMAQGLPGMSGTDTSGRRIALLPFDGTTTGLTPEQIDVAVKDMKQDVENGVIPEAPFKDFDLDALAAEAKQNLTDVYENGIQQDRVRQIETLRARMEIREDGAFRELVVDGDVMLRVDLNTKAGRAAFPYFELTMVVIDLFFVILALINVAVAIDDGVKKAVEAIVKNMKDTFMGIANSFIDAIRSVLPEMQAAEAAGSLATKVKELLSAIANGFWKVGEHVWNNWSNAYKGIKEVFKAFLSSGWAVASALFSLGAFLAAFVVTGGAAVIVQLGYLIAALCQLIHDTLIFSAALGEEKPRKAVPA